MENNKGLRYNKGKVRLDLIPEFPINEIGKILTYGANKYTIVNENDDIIETGDNNWKKGMSWKSIIASTKRHLSAFEKGEDYDKESNLLHIAHAATNLIFLLEYYKIHPEDDDRDKKYLNKRIGLDIDGPCADFINHFFTYLKLDKTEPKYWNDFRIRKNFHLIEKDIKFWLSIPPSIKGEDLPFEPVLYCTARPIDSSITEKWLEKNGFPYAPVITVPHQTSKVDAIKGKCDIFIDDNYDNFIQLNDAGINCYLFTQSHNKKYDVGFKRISTFEDLIEKI